jgi:hypothetical protein
VAVFHPAGDPASRAYEANESRKSTSHVETGKNR